MRDELDEPLGVRPTPPRLRARLAPYAAWTARLGALAAILVCGGLAWRALEAPSRQTAVVRYEDVAVAEPPKPAPAATPDPAAQPAETLRVVKNGEPAPARTGGPQIIDVAEALGRAADARLAEPSAWGALPRVAPDGVRPAQAYARKRGETEAGRGAPRIALFVGGLGLDAEATRWAAERLPPDVSLGFAPYGADLASSARRAREAGHELWLQAPMEGVVGAAPGPHTLTTAATAAENRDALHWSMARFQGYVGVAGYLGGKLTADAQAFSPVLAEIGRRGLLYLDDGSSAQSRAQELAPGLDVVAARADVYADPDGAALDAALDRAEDIARRRGSAILAASAAPATLERLARWTRSLADKGFALAPVSALAGARADRDARAAP